MVTAKADEQIVEFEIDTPNNSNFYFRPLMRQVRGTFDFRRVKEPMPANFTTSGRCRFRARG